MKRQLLVAAVLSFAVAACSSSSSPTAPASLTGSTSASGSGASGGAADATPASARPSPEPAWEARGMVTRLHGSCPAISFVLGGAVLVHATRSTEFVDLECGRIENGDYVKVIGTRQRDGSVIARAIGR